MCTYRGRLYARAMTTPDAPRATAAALEAEWHRTVALTTYALPRPAEGELFTVDLPWTVRTHDAVEAFLAAHPEVTLVRRRTRGTLRLT